MPEAAIGQAAAVEIRVARAGIMGDVNLAMAPSASGCLERSLSALPRSEVLGPAGVELGCVHPSMPSI
jgi:hypothetical protein